MDEILASSFKTIFDQVDYDAIKRDVDEIGFDRFVEECARLSGVTGAAAGLGGALTMVVGVPASIINNIAQQFRITLAAIYGRGGALDKPSFDEFMRIVGASLGIPVGMKMGNAILISIANSMLARLGASSVGVMIPLIGAVIGGGLSYHYIKSIGTCLKTLDMGCEGAPLAKAA